MVNANSISGNSTNGHLLECASDYEPCSHADTAPQPKWRDAWPMFTHKGGWTDTDGKTHSLTIRRDTLQGGIAAWGSCAACVVRSRHETTVVAAPPRSIGREVGVVSTVPYCYEAL